MLARRGTVPRYRPTERHSAVRPRVTKRPTGAHDVDGVDPAMCSSCGCDWTPNDLLRLHDAYLEHNKRLTCKARRRAQVGSASLPRQYDRMSVADPAHSETVAAGKKMPVRQQRQVSDQGLDQR